MIPATEKRRETDPGYPIRWTLDSKNSVKGWYEQTLEEEEEEADGDLAPLEDSFSSLTKIKEPSLEPIPGGEEIGILVMVAPAQKNLRTPFSSVSEENLDEENKKFL